MTLEPLEEYKYYSIDQLKNERVKYASLTLKLTKPDDFTFNEMFYDKYKQVMMEFNKRAITFSPVGEEQIFMFAKDLKVYKHKYEIKQEGKEKWLKQHEEIVKSWCEIKRQREMWEHTTYLEEWIEYLKDRIYEYV